MTESYEDDGVLVLPAVLDLTAAEPLHRELLDRVRTGEPLMIAGGAVERLSTAAVQVLLAAAAEVRSRGGSLQLREPSSALTDALVDLGVAVHFGL